MSKTVLDRVRMEDGQPAYFENEVAELLARASDAVCELSGMAHYITLPDGRAIAGFNIVEEVLSDGSKVYDIRIVAA